MRHLATSPEQWLHYMPAAQHQRQELRLVEAIWDHLSLLSSMSLLSSRASSGGDLAQARHDFAALSADLMCGLASEALDNRLDDLETQAQVCIDILVRNLFERTADIGFFSTDDSMAEYLRLPEPEERLAIESRLHAYASKYTVYGNIFLFDTEGRLQASLRSVPPVGSASVERDDQVFLQSVLQSRVPYVEHYGVHGFTGDGGLTLLYAHRIESGGLPVGVMCLEFRLSDEMQAIFASAREGSALGGGSDAVLALVDREGRVLGSSDALLLPAGWRLAQAGAAGVHKVCHAGRRCLVAVRDTQGFQGYEGPGWRGVVLLPLDLAFDQDLQSDSGEATAELSGNADLLSDGLREIPRRSAVIQSALERSVWNGLLELHQLGEDAAIAPRELLFAKTLLSEIGVTARRTAQAFAGALQDLYGVVLRALLRDARSRASLAMQILDRNLYERANDCRWWALSPQFARTLSAGQAGCADATAVLGTINGLYTVYACLVLFDRSGRVMAVSRPDQAHHVGTVLDDDWVERCLRLADSQQYTVSRYTASRFYAHGPTFVYAAAVRDVGGTGPVLGGIAVVWDAADQLKSILADCAVGADARDVLAIVDAQDGLVLANGDATLLADPRTVAACRSGGPTATLEGHLYGIGLARGQGYREFRTQDGYDHGLGCMVLRHISHHRAGLLPALAPAAQPGAPRIAPEHRLQMASFLLGAHWMGLEAAQVVAAAPDRDVLHAGSARPPFMGLTQIGERVFSVVDLRAVVAGPLRDAGLSRVADPQRQMVVVRVPLDDGRQREFVLRVDALGPMLDLDRRDIQPVGVVGDSAAGTALIDAVVPVATATATAATPAMLCRISARWLQQCALGILGDEEPHDVDAVLASIV